MKTDRELSEFEAEMAGGKPGLTGPVYAVARALGISRSVISRLQDAGMPAPGGKVSAGEVLRRLVAEARGKANAEHAEADEGMLRKLDPSDIRARKLVAETERVERHNAAERGETLMIPDVIAIVGEEYGVIRAGLSSIPGRVTQEITAASGVAPDTVQRILSGEVARCLNALGKSPSLNNGVEHAETESDSAN